MTKKWIVRTIGVVSLLAAGTLLFSCALHIRYGFDLAGGRWFRDFAVGPAWIDMPHTRPNDSARPLFYQWEAPLPAYDRYRLRSSGGPVPVYICGTIFSLYEKISWDNFWNPYDLFLDLLDRGELPEEEARRLYREMLRIESLPYEKRHDEIIRLRDDLKARGFYRSPAEKTPVATESRNSTPEAENG